MNLLETTIVKDFQERVRENGDKIFVKHFKDGSWREVSWSEYGDIVKKIACGLLEIGVSRKDGICIMSGTRAEWGMADIAVLSIGCVTGAIYPTLLGDDAAYIVNDMKAPVVFAEGAVQRDELLLKKDQMPQLKKLIVIDGNTGEDPLCMSLDSLVRLGVETMARHEGTFHDTIDSITQDDIATVIYTSGTTGIPKGAVHSHQSIMYTVANSPYPFEPGMTDLSYLPMAHVFERFGGFFAEIYLGNNSIGYFRGDLKGIVSDFAVLKPSVNRTAPRLLEKLYSVVLSTVAARGEEAKRGFERALFVAKKIRIDEALFGIEPGDDIRREFTEIMKEDPFTMVRQFLGGEMKFFYGGGAPIPKEVTEFFFAAGIPVYELYGTSETVGTVTNYPGKVKPGTIGVPFPRGEWPGEMGLTRLADDGEIENKGPNVLIEYLNMPNETKSSFTKDGWFMTGDIGRMDEDGFITIIGRKKDIIITAGGKNIAPQKIENHVKETGYFSQVMAYGDKKKYITALLVLDPSMIVSLSTKLGIDLPNNASDEEKYRLVAVDKKTRDFLKTIVEERNTGLFKQERIVDFVLSNRDLSIENDEITPTMKLKKKSVTTNFGDRLEALYDE